MNEDIKKRLSKIRLIIMDVDGVLTDGRIYFNDRGEVMKAFHVHDGYGLRLAREHGLMLAAITGMISPVTRARLEHLNITDIVEGCMEKADALKALCEQKGLSHEEVLFIGDDLFDLGAFAEAGICVAVADALGDVKKRADYVTQKSGGQGAVREIIDIVLKEKSDGQGSINRGNKE